MLTHIQTFFTSLLGTALPEICYVLIALALTYLVLRMFLSIFNVNTKILDFTFYVVIGYLAVSNLGGLVWNFSL